MTNHKMTEDRELDLWREQWSGVALPSPEFKRQIQKRIKIQDRRFWAGNLLALVALVGTLVRAVYQITHHTSRLEKSEATGVVVLLFVAVVCRLWFMRGTWRAETQSIRASLELWHRRVLAQIRRLQIGIYIAIGWLGFGTVIVSSNWATIRLEVVPHPIAFLILMVVIVGMLPVIWFGVMWFRRRKVAELNEVTRLLEEMEILNG